MKYNFDEIIERRGTDTYKYGNLGMVCGREDVLPMWVADMDFKTPPFVMDAIQHRLQQQVLGYTCPSEVYYASIVNWCDTHFGWQICTSDINYVPGVVCGIYLAMQAFTEKGDKILIQDPVYHPFRIVPEGSSRTIVWNHLERTEHSVAMNLEALRKDIKGCKMMILCNPHNPAGKCWDVETLREVAHICHEEGVVVVSDEIHCDIVKTGESYTSILNINKEIRDNSIVLIAASKCFNMAGLQSGTVVRPKAVLCFGISGAVQFTEGIKGEPLVIAINNDPEAAILGFAQYAAVMDMGPVLKELNK